MSARRSPALAFALLVGGACVGACVYAVTPSLDGLRCDAEHACVDGYTCVGGLCVLTADVPPVVVVRGAFDKGPFVLGSSITVAALDAAGAPTGQVFPTTTLSDRGDFELPVALRGTVSFEGEGFYWNEALGQLSLAPIVLRGVGVLSGDAQQTWNVNLLTHLSSQRAMALITAGADAGAAVAQAEQELVAAVGIGAGAAPGGAGGALALAGPDADAWLLALSAVVAQGAVIAAGGPDAGNPVDAALQELVNTIAADLADDGAIEPPLRARLDEAEAAVDVEAVVAALADRLADIGSPDAPADLGAVIDEDNDGRSHGADNCPTAANPEQEDADADDVGDACDCGNNTIDADNGEQCDGAALPADAPAGASCSPTCVVVVVGCAAAGAACAQNDDCCDGGAPLECSANVCVEAPCVAAGGACAGASQCCAGLSCDPTNTCSACRVNAEICGTDGECCSGSCLAGLCGTCAIDEQACSGSCVDVSLDVNNCGDCGITCPVDNTCASGVCTPPAAVCGNGSVEAGEGCDDGGGGASGDGCSSACIVEVGYACTGTPSVCVATCGDGVVVGAESCDDGDSAGGDGCSATCTVEVGFVCTGFPSICSFNNGAACGAPAECGSGFCVDNVCCQSACGGLCQACTAPNGSCDAFPVGTDPESECPGTCNGAGGCQ